MRESRQFFDGNRSMNVAWLEWIRVNGQVEWHVQDYGGIPAVYEDTEEGYRAARADYEARVAKWLGREGYR